MALEGSFVNGEEAIKFRFVDGKPVVELRRPGESGWTEHRYTSEGEDWYVTDSYAIKGILLAATSHRRLAQVEMVLPAEVDVFVLETEFDNNERTGEMLHAVDIYNKNDDHLFSAKIEVAGGKITKIRRWS